MEREVPTILQSLVNGHFAVARLHWLTLLGCHGSCLGWGGGEERKIAWGGYDRVCSRVGDGNV